MPSQREKKELEGEAPLVSFEQRGWSSFYMFLVFYFLNCLNGHVLQQDEVKLFSLFDVIYREMLDSRTQGLFKSIDLGVEGGVSF